MYEKQLDFLESLGMEETIEEIILRKYDTCGTCENMKVEENSQRTYCNKITPTVALSNLWINKYNICVHEPTQYKKRQ